MARVSIDEVNAWNEESKTALESLDAAWLPQIEAQVLAALSASDYDTSTWVDPASTPQLVRSIIAMMYIAWHYDKHYAEDVDEGNAYSKLLRSTARANIAGILDGTFVLDDGVPLGTADKPSFYPNDLSSAGEVYGDSSTGPAKFSMGMRF